MLPMDLLTDRHDANTVQLARGLDDRRAARDLAKHLQKLVQPGERIGLPAVLGLDAHSEGHCRSRADVRCTSFRDSNLAAKCAGHTALCCAARQIAQYGCARGDGDGSDQRPKSGGPKWVGRA